MACGSSLGHGAPWRWAGLAGLLQSGGVDTWKGGWVEANSLLVL